MSESDESSALSLLQPFLGLSFSTYVPLVFQGGKKDERYILVHLFLSILQLFQRGFERTEATELRCERAVTSWVEKD